MPEKSPFHDRTAALCASYRWKDWAGYHAVVSYDSSHESEYYAFRHAAGLQDVSPLFKYAVRGPDAAAFLAWVTTRDIRRLRPGRVAYVTWCDGDGKLVDDGTVTCLEPDWFRVTAAEPSLVWFERLARGYDVRIEDVSRALGALSVQGPGSRAVLSEALEVDLSGLRFFRARRVQLGAAELLVSRTGYTGDLGYEVWVPREHALPVWDAIMGVGLRHGLVPAGLAALDVTRVEAGFVMNGVDYHGARHCLIDARKSSPFEMGLDWTVELDRDPFVGQEALRAERRAGGRAGSDGAAWRFVGLTMDWPEIEALYEHHNLPPNIPSAAWRDPRPVYDDRGRQLGYATSGAWSPILKENLALAHLQAPYAIPGTRVQIELTVEFERKTVTATVCETPFFDPPRKRGR